MFVFCVCAGGGALGHYDIIFHVLWLTVCCQRLIQMLLVEAVTFAACSFHSFYTKRFPLSSVESMLPNLKHAKHRVFFFFTVCLMCITSLGQRSAQKQ